MKVVVSGGSGFIGQALVNRLFADKHDVIILTRNPAKESRSESTVRKVQWDGKTVGAWVSDLDGVDAVVNFAGESLAAKRWTRAQKAILLSSRFDATRALVDAMAKVRPTPSVLVNASAVGFYGHVDAAGVTEDSPRGNDFLAELTAEWESEANRAKEFGVRVVTPRFGLVLDGAAGALPRLVLPFKLFVGGWLGSGRQWFPWIHLADVVSAMMLAITNKQIVGALNLTAPESVTNKEFCKVLGSVLHRPCWAPAPEPILRIALGEMAEMLLTGQRAIPNKLLQSGFEFRYPTVRQALEEIFKQ